jgi:hypothetical protein
MSASNLSRVVAADVQFRLAANAAAAQYAAAPPFLAYRTAVDINVPALNRHKLVERAVETRTKDDFAVLQDLPNGQRQYGQSFPLTPIFDALSYWRIDYSPATHRNLLSHITMFQPLTFSDPQPSSPGVNAVSTTLRNYYAAYADDSTPEKAHVLMTPLPAFTRDNSSDFYFHDLYIDTATNLPTRVTYTGRDDAEFTIDYVVTQQHWFVSHVFYRRAYVGPFHIGRTSFTVDATFDSFAIEAAPADARVASAPPIPPPKP